MPSWWIQDRQPEKSPDIPKFALSHVILQVHPQVYIQTINAVAIRHQRPFRAATASDDTTIVFHQGG
jgi:hypothetical protein